MLFQLWRLYYIPELEKASAANYVCQKSSGNAPLLPLSLTGFGPATLFAVNVSEYLANGCIMPVIGLYSGDPVLIHVTRPIF